MRLAAQTHSAATHTAAHTWGGMEGSSSQGTAALTTPHLFRATPVSDDLGPTCFDGSSVRDQQHFEAAAAAAAAAAYGAEAGRAAAAQPSRSNQSGGYHHQQHHHHHAAGAQHGGAAASANAQRPGAALSKAVVAILAGPKTWSEKVDRFNSLAELLARQVGKGTCQITAALCWCAWSVHSRPASCQCIWLRGQPCASPCACAFPSQLMRCCCMLPGLSFAARRRLSRSDDQRCGAGNAQAADTHGRPSFQGEFGCTLPACKLSCFSLTAPTHQRLPVPRPN